MSDVQVLYAEEISGTITASTTSWVDVCSIPAASFTTGKKYLILANIVTKMASASNEVRVRLVHGTTPTVFTDASLAYEGLNGTQQHENSYLFQYTQPGTTELIKLQLSVSGTLTGTCILGQIIAINLDDVGAEGTDYFSNEFLTDYTMTGTPTAKAITSSFTPNGSDRWLFIGHQIYDVVGITTPIGFELYDSVAGVLNSCQQEGEDGTNDFLGNNQYWAGIPTNAARTLAVRPFNSGSAVMLASRVIAINLAKLAQSASVFDATGVDPATYPTRTTVATVAPTPTATGNWVIIGFSNQDVNETTTEIAARMEINPDGSGLVEDPPLAPATPPGIDNWDATDIVPFSVFNLPSLTLGGARTINYEWTQFTGTLGRVEGNGLVAFSVALATTGYTLDLASGSYALTGAALTPLADRLLALTAGAYALTGQAASLLQGFVLSLEPGSYLLTGSALGLLADRLLNLAPGTYTLSGQDAALLAGRLLVAEAGTYTLTGAALETLVARALNLEPGSYGVTGQPLTVLAARLLGLSPGAYDLAGADLTPLADRQLVLESGVYLYTGADAELIYVPVGGYTLNLEPGVYNLTGASLAPLAQRFLDLASGGYVVAGQSLTALADRLLDLAAGIYNVSGAAQTEQAARLLVLNSGTYLYTGADAELIYVPSGAYSLNLEAGVYVLTGAQMSFVIPALAAVPAVPDAAIIFTASARGQIRTLTPREWWRLVLGRDLPEEFAPPAIVEYDETLDLLLML